MMINFHSQCIRVLKKDICNAFFILSSFLVYEQGLKRTGSFQNTCSENIYNYKRALVIGGVWKHSACLGTLWPNFKNYSTLHFHCSISNLRKHPKTKFIDSNCIVILAKFDLNEELFKI